MAKKSQVATNAKKTAGQHTASEKPSPVPPDGQQVAGAAKKYHWPPHPMSELFPGMTTEEFRGLKENMVERVLLGMDPLERPIILLDDRIFDGRNRDSAWMELAEEGACDGYFARNTPPFERFTPAKHGTLAAWMKAKSLNMVHRDIPAAQKAGILLEAEEKFPEIKAAIEEIKKENEARKQKGKPLATGDQRGNTAEQLGDLAGAGPTTVKGMSRLRKEAPDKFNEVMEGKITLKQALASLPKKDKGVKNKTPKGKAAKPGLPLAEALEIVFRVKRQLPFRFSDN